MVRSQDFPTQTSVIVTIWITASWVVICCSFESVPVSARISSRRIGSSLERRLPDRKSSGTVPWSWNGRLAGRDILGWLERRGKGRSGILWCFPGSHQKKSDDKRQVYKAMVLKRESALIGAWKNEWRQREDLNLHALQGCATERSSRVFLISNPHLTTDQDRRDWIPSILALP